MYSDDSDDSDGSSEAYNEKNRKNKRIRWSGSTGHNLYVRLKAGTVSRGWMHAAVLSAIGVVLIVALRSNHGENSGDNAGNISMPDGGAPTVQESDPQQSLRAQRKLFQDVVKTSTIPITPAIPKKTTIPKSGRKPTTPVPAQSRKTFYIDTGYPTNRPIARALRIMGWRRVESRHDAQMVYTYSHKKRYYKDLQPWQRYNHMPNRNAFNSKDEFQYHMSQYEKATGDKIWTLPETYRLDDESEKEEFVRRLESGGGMDSPWVLKKPKVNQGRGITMLGPHTKALSTVVQNVTKELAEDPEKAPKYIIQKYICRELTIQRRKFDFRVFWMVASLDPLVVLYHDGYVRIGNSEYDESDFSSTTAHLTTHTGLASEGKGSWEDLKKVLLEYLEENKDSNPILAAIEDPMDHVRNQVKQALGQMAAAFKEPTFHTKGLGEAENGFGFFGADFILDQDLDAWFIEPQGGCGLDEDWQFRIDMHNSLFGSMGNLVEEVAGRQEKGVTLDNLEQLGGYELVYNDGWLYKYDGYERSQDKKGCELSNQSADNGDKAKKSSDGKVETQ